MLSDGLAGTGVAVGVSVGVGVNVGVAVAVDVGVGVGVETCTEPSSVVPSRRTPSSLTYTGEGLDEKPTLALEFRHKAPSLTVKAIVTITPSGIAEKGRTGSAMTMSISPSESCGLCPTLVVSNSDGTDSVTESARPSALLSVGSKLRQVSS
ncbi:MAG: hypothetical protein OXD46_11595 [Chloroflexi bacterium]|nr:hypothetical protein [Chloroflexota bacterium]